MREYYVYILASCKNGTTYIGMTNNLLRRMSEHRKKTNLNSFSARHNVTRLVYYEKTSYVNNAIAREKQLKGLLRTKKIKLIMSANPEWLDLSKDWDLS